MAALFVYVTCADKEEAKSIASRVIEKRMAACANIFQPHESLYWWDGAVQNDQEVAMILKTTAERFPALKEEIITLHSYDCPCIVALPVEAGHQEFLNWIDEQTSS